LIKNSKEFGGIGAPDIERKIFAFRVMLLLNIQAYSNLKCFDYFIDQFFREILDAEIFIGLKIDQNGVALWEKSRPPEN